MHFADYKTILSPKNGMNLYRGCTHGCIYCDSRSKCYQIKHDFEDIEVKRNAPEILEQQLRRRRQRSMISTGSMCDHYMPLEADLELTRQCLAVIEKYGFGLAILTKSDLILRDLDLLAAIQSKAKCVVQVTLTTYDDELCRIIEPHVASTSERVKVLEQMAAQGIPTVVWLCPTLPFINDTEENLLGLLDYCVQSKVQGILNFGFGLTLREGNREYFYQQLDIHFPGMKERYISQYAESYSCDSPNNAHLREVFKSECRRQGILYRTDDVFAYLREFPSPEAQTRLFSD
jgi:DNA repair photolyase